MTTTDIGTPGEPGPLLMLLAELHDAVVETHPRVAAWVRHCMFPLTVPQGIGVARSHHGERW